MCAKIIEKWDKNLPFRGDSAGFPFDDGSLLDHGMTILVVVGFWIATGLVAARIEWKTNKTEKEEDDNGRHCEKKKTIYSFRQVDSSPAETLLLLSFSNSAKLPHFVVMFDLACRHDV